MAVDEKGVERTRPLDISNARPPEPARRPARLEVIAIAANRFADPRLPAIPRAERDGRDLAKFLGDRLVDPATNARFRPEQVRVRPFLGAEAASGSILAAFDEFRSEGAAPDGLPAPGDVVAVVIESHYLDVGSKPMIASTEAGAGDDPMPPAVAASDLATRLGELTRLGCRVVVMIDAVHDLKAAPGWRNDIEGWIRRLQAESKVVVFLASDHGPSLALGDGHRSFAEGVLTMLDARAAGRPRDPSAPMTFFDAQRTIADTVFELTGRKQHTQCYLPEIVPPQAPFFDPR